MPITKLIFSTLINAAARETKTTDLTSPSLKVLADHIRACSFLIADGVIPGNEGRGYVLRRIIRRAIRHGYKLGARKAFFHNMVADLANVMGVAYPELVKEQTRIVGTLKLEEDRFFETIENGMAILEAELANKPTVFNGDLAFKLHDTFGFPLDLTADICRERNVSVDTAGFDAAMARQKDQARAAGKFKMATNVDYSGATTDFKGYETLETQATVLALYQNSTSVTRMDEGAQGIVVLSVTPFYAESGGQVGDNGMLKSENGIFAVEDTQKIQAAVFGHHGILKTGTLNVGDTVKASVDMASRASTMRNHSATHLMHKALREVLGEHVQQKGSLVDADKTRFDFVHNAPMTDAEIAKVEAK
jgi:alanyl-tRNA synthetase